MQQLIKNSQYFKKQNKKKQNKNNTKQQIKRFVTKITA